MNKKECTELEEPFKVTLNSTRYSILDYKVYVETVDPTLLLEICATIIKILKERGCKPEVLFGDMPTMQKAIDEGAEAEKDA